jgi:2-methylcitrate dehydratase PrpD
LADFSWPGSHRIGLSASVGTASKECQMPPQYGETFALVESLIDLQYQALPPEVVDTAKLCLLDTVGAGLYASQTPWAKKAAQVALEVGGEGQCVIWGRSHKTTAPLAALANGIAAHGMELDDRKPSARLHPGSHVIPAALAAAEKVGSDGKNLITAVVAGYETSIRVGMAVPQQRKGVNSAQHKGIWGAVAAACKALSMDNEQTLNAFGVAGSLASGISEYSGDSAHTMVKRLIGGGPAHGGVLAALLGQQGFTGPWTVLEGRHGYCRAYAGDQGVFPEELTRNLGEGDGYAILGREVKPYATWGGAHIGIEAVEQIKRQYGVVAEEVEKITVACSLRLLEDRVVRRPESISTAQRSLPFILALAFHHDLRDPSIWTEAILNNREVLALIDKIECRLDEDIDRDARNAGGHGQIKLTIRLLDGAERHAAVSHSKGMLENPMTGDEIIDKFRFVAGKVLAPRTCEEIVDTIIRLENVDDIRRLGELALVR